MDRYGKGAWTRATALSLVLSGLFLVGVIAAQSTEKLEAAFTASVTSGEAPLTVEFDASNSIGEDLTYEWRFGDGGKAEGARVTHTFEKLGEFGVILTVRDGEQRETDTQIVTVQGDGPPVVVQVPFTVNENELKEAYMVLDLYGPAYLESATTVPSSPVDQEGEFQFFNLVAEEGDAIIGVDFVYYGLKDMLIFDAEHTAKAFILEVQGMLGMPGEDYPEFYSRIPAHPRYEYIVSTILEQGGLFTGTGAVSESEREFGLLINSVGKDIARKLYEDKGILTPTE